MGHPPSFDLRLVEPFVVLAAEDLHFRCAAQRLGIGQPGLSRQMDRLQRQLRAPLIVRDGRRHHLTPAGSRFLTHAGAVLRRAAALSAELDAGADTVRIHMGVDAHRGARDLVTSFMIAHPAVRVEIVEGLSADARRALLRQAVDVAFDLRTGCPPGMRFEPVDRSPLGVLTRREHPIAREETAAWLDLTGEPILFGPAEDGSWNAIVRGALAAAGVEVTEKIAPPMPKLHYLVPSIARGELSMITARALFEPAPPELTWTVLTPHQYLEYGVTWDPRRRTRATERFLAFVRRRVTVDAPTGVAAPSRPVVTGPPRDSGDDDVHPPGFDLRLVLPFATVAEELHFGRAATRLSTAQPALSRQVARLEAQLGAVLLARSTRQMELTSAGHRTLAASRDILDRARQARLAALPARSGPRR